MFDKMFENAVNASKVTIGVNEGDYIGPDGLWYCGKCHTQKQTRVKMLDREFTPMCLCECAQKQIDDYENAEVKRRMEEEKARRRIEAFDGAGRPDWTFEKDDQTSEAVKIARKYVAHWDEMREAGKGILFFGDVGTGKSFAAACIVNALIDKGCRVKMTSPSAILAAAKKWDGTEDWGTYDLLVLDDLMAERETTYAQEVIQQVVEARYLARKPLIVTSNLTAEELKNPVDIRRARMFSRMLELCIPLEIKGSDRRKEALKNDFEKYKKMLTTKPAPEK